MANSSLEKEFLKGIDMKYRKINEDNDKYMLFNSLEEYEPYNITNNVISKFEISDNGTFVSIPNFQDKCKKISLRKAPRYVQVMAHKHTYIEFLYVYSGVVKQEINGKELIMKKGDICLLNTETIHSREALKEDDILIVMIITKESFDQMFLSLRSHNDILYKFIIDTFYKQKSEANYLYFNTSKNPPAQIMEQIIYEYYDAKLGWKTAMEAFMLLLFTELLRNFNDLNEQQTFASSQDELICSIIEHINQNYRNVSLATLAKHFHFSKSHISNVIKRHTGNNFIDILTEIKLKNACTLLRNTNLSINEIILAIGYNNTTHFYNLFNKYYNTTPDEYRRKQKF